MAEQRGPVQSPSRDPAGQCGWAAPACPTHWAACTSGSASSGNSGARAADCPATVTTACAVPSAAPGPSRHVILVGSAVRRAQASGLPGGLPGAGVMRTASSHCVFSFQIAIQTSPLQSTPESQTPALLLRQSPITAPAAIRASVDLRGAIPRPSSRGSMWVPLFNKVVPGGASRHSWGTSWQDVRRRHLVFLRQSLCCVAPTGAS